MRAGQLRHQVALQSLVPGRDAAGQPTMVWTTTATVRGDIRFLNGIGTIKADAPVSIARASIRIRFMPDVTAAMRVIGDGRTFDIKAVLPDPTGRRWLDLACEQGANNG